MKHKKGAFVVKLYVVTLMIMSTTLTNPLQQAETRACTATCGRFKSLSSNKGLGEMPVADSNFARYRDVERNGMKNVNGGRAFCAGGDIVF